jgi:hypothetical protein
VVAYRVRDILWLRLFAVAASLITISYFVLQPTTLWAPLSWSIVFAAINLLQSWRLFIERRPVKLTSEEEEEEIRKLAFRDLPHNKQKSSERITSNKESRVVPRSSAFERRAVIHGEPLCWSASNQSSNRFRSKCGPTSLASVMEVIFDCFFATLPKQFNLPRI